MQCYNFSQQTCNPGKPRKAPDTKKGHADYQLIKLVLPRLTGNANPFWSVLCSNLQLSLVIQGGLVPGHPIHTTEYMKICGCLSPLYKMT